jgi:hypothetical protein
MRSDNLSRAGRGFAMTLTAAMCACASAQCVERWMPGYGYPGVGSAFGGTDIESLTHWDPDGPGPRGEVVVIGGYFRIAGDEVARGLATWDPATGEFDSIGGGVEGTVYAALAAPNGDLIVGGEFISAGGKPANNIARWDGRTWTTLGGGTSGVIRSLLLLPSGDLAVGGVFSSPCTGVARWDGSGWFAFGEGLRYPSTLALDSAGRLLAGGQFTGGNVARWSGEAWESIGGGVNGSVGFIFPYADGSIVIGGSFYEAGGQPANLVARWDGTQWSQLGDGLLSSSWSSSVGAMIALPHGELVASGGFDHSGTEQVGPMARWDGTRWTRFGDDSPLSTALSLLPNGDVLAGGDFQAAGGAPAEHLARWDGQRWNALGQGFDGSVQDILICSNGDIYATGTFTMTPRRVRESHRAIARRRLATSREGAERLRRVPTA